MSFLTTSIFMIIMTLVAIFIFCGIIVYYLLRKDKISMDTAIDSLPIIGGSTGTFIKVLPVDVTQSLYDIYGNPMVMTPEVQLDLDSHTYAMKKYCESNGYKYDYVDNTCVHTKDTCMKSITDDESGIKIEWHDPYCIQTFSLWKSLCERYDLEYKQADITCDPQTKTCSVNKSETTEHGLSLPTCIIPKSYCKSKGVDYDPLNNGDCYTNDAQAIASFVFGTTLTNMFRKNGEEAIESCGGPGALALLALTPIGGFAISPECAKNLAKLLFTPFAIVVDTAIKTYTDVGDDPNLNAAQKAVFGTIAVIFLPFTMFLSAFGIGKNTEPGCGWGGTSINCGNKPYRPGWS